jgi:hypothetical protein
MNRLIPEGSAKEKRTMAKVILNPVVRQIRGKLGGMVFRLSHNGKLIVTRTPDMSRVKWSKAQKEHRQRFKQAVAYAKAAMANPQVRTVYEKMVAKNHKRPFDTAISDYFKGNNLLSKG